MIVTGIGHHALSLGFWRIIVPMAPLAVFVLNLALCSATRGQDPGTAPDQVSLKRIVHELASPEYAGRRGAGARKAEAYLVGQFEELGLEPLFGDRYTQSIPAEEPGTIYGRNVGGVIRGADPDHRADWILIAAHYDHLGMRNGEIYPGADDNASGVAMLLEVARGWVESDVPSSHSLMFVSFDLEEYALWGSRYFVQNPPIALDRIRIMITADMLGRALGGVCDDHLFIAGTEHIPTIRPWLTDWQADQDRLFLGLIGTDLIGTRSDYGPFRSRSIPYLFFSTGESPHYHRPSDVAETLDYDKLRAATRLILDLTRHLDGLESLPVWDESPGPSLEEAQAIRSVLKVVLERRDRLGVPGFQARLLQNSVDRIDRILESGTITDAERSGLLTVARLTLLTILSGREPENPGEETP